MSKKNTIKVVFSFILGMIITSGTVFAVNLISSGDVSFSSTKGLQSTNVQAAIDEVYADVVDINSVKGKTNKIDFVTSNDITEKDSWILSEGLVYEFARVGKMTTLTITIPNNYDFSQPCHTYLSSQTNCLAFEIPNNNKSASFMPVQSQAGYTAKMYTGGGTLNQSGGIKEDTVGVTLIDATADALFPTTGPRRGFILLFGRTPSPFFDKDITISFDFVNKSDY